METIEAVIVFMGVSEEGEGAIRGEIDNEDEGDGGGIEGDGTRGMRMGEEAPLELGGESSATVEE